jgi:hypothetical protein
MSTTDFVLSMLASLLVCGLAMLLIVQYSTAHDAERPRVWRYVLSGLAGLAAIAVTFISVRVALDLLARGMFADAAINFGTGLLLAVVFGSVASLLVADGDDLSDLPPDSRISDDRRAATTKAGGAS